MSSAFGQTLQYITTIKLEELERQRAACRIYVDETLKSASSAPDPVARVDVLLKQIRGWKGLGGLISKDISLDNYESWLHQARFDSSISPPQVEKWATMLESQLRQAVTRYDYAKLFGDLLNEWLKSGDSLATAAVPESTSDAPASPTSWMEEKVARPERLVQQDRIQELIFSKKDVDVAAIQMYLSSLFFSEPEAAAALTNLRTSLKNFGESLVKQTAGTGDMRDLIKSLLSRDLLNAEKSATLKGFLDSEVIIEEVTSVLNMQLASIDSWDWPVDGVGIEMRRHLSGKYRAYMDNEIMQALLFQYIGMQWSVKFKQAFRSVAESRAWKHETPPLSREQLKRRKDFLGEPNATSSVEKKRQDMQLDQFFLTQLPSEIEGETPYDEEPSSWDNEKPNQGLNAQQVLLRLVGTEAYLKTALHGSCTIMRADLEWFGPSIPHDSVLTVLRFFGMPDRWVTFLKKWLGAKLRFDGSEPQTRTRGVPIAHSLSVLCGEALLFGMDFAVNQRARGLYVYRIYDDFWYYSHDKSLCADAWKEMNTYADLVGITFNKKKTGGVCVGSELEPTLPKGTVGWGFLIFDAAQGRFVVDQDAVNTHIAELRRQLAAARSVFGYVNALNKYLEFFRRNFAQPSHCFGRTHADEVVATFGRIQREVFAETGGSVVRAIQAMVETRFGINDVPAGWCFMPVAQGGLGVVDPIVDILTVRANVKEKPEEEFQECMKEDENTYSVYKASWLGGAGEGTELDFMPWDEYVLGRETKSLDWGQAWTYLQVVAPSRSIARSTVLGNDWYNRSDVEKWIVSLYADEIMEKFGDLKIVEPTLIPVGMLSALRSAKIAWDS